MCKIKSRLLHTQPQNSEGRQKIKNTEVKGSNQREEIKWMIRISSPKISDEEPRHTKM